MRRSVREALVGFSLLTAIAGGLGLWFWLRGVSLRRDTWTIRASFADAAGLAERSPVSFRGVLVGSVRRIQVTGQAVLADLEITDPSLRLSRPVVARVGAGSLLGGDAVVSLLSAGQPLPDDTPRARDRRCDDRRMVCNGGKVRGVAAASLDSVTDTVQKLLDEAQRSQLVPKLVQATASFDRTLRETEKLSRGGQAFIGDARSLVRNADAAVTRAHPILTNLRAASASAARAGRDVSAITGALNTPRTVGDLQSTVGNARRLTEHWASVGGQVDALTADPSVRDGLRSVLVGLGAFFEELYPARVDAARQRDAAREGSGGGPGAAAASPPPPPREPLPPPPPKQRTLSGADRMELWRIERGSGAGSGLTPR
jgi:phospholipid/cholesterol/gamma-HCH transport system substrate-binding protein